MAPRYDELLFVPLGGVGEIGMNLALYGLGAGGKRQWLCVDMGVAFADAEIPGVELIMPDIRFLEGERQNLAGIVLTHGHEDHVGAIFDLWPKLGVPVFATPFTAALIESKREMEEGAPAIPIHIVQAGARTTIGPFDVEFVPVAHSIPESNALALRTTLGLVVHTGDWKLDPTPVVGAVTDERKFRALGAEGVRAVICDSTNAVREGRSPSEADVAKKLVEIVRAAKGRVAVTTFASNVARIRSAALAAAAAGREVVVVGRAMERVINVAREMRLLDGVPQFRGVDAYSSLARERVLVLLTGSQGEPRAALARIAGDDHPDIELDHGDTLIFSSRTIPGNEKAVNRILNEMIRCGVKVITDRTELVHVSGHPRRGELSALYQWLRPEVAVPVHGEALHLSEHAALARGEGVGEVVLCGDGDVLRLAPAPAGVIDEVPSGRLYRDGALLVEAEARTVAERKKLGFAGVVSVALALGSRGEIAGEPMVELSGLPQLARGGKAMEDVVYDAIGDALTSLPKQRRRDPDAIEEAIIRSIRGQVNAAWGKKPLCHVMVLQI
ncbi:MAG TPA: ribonuclease J [Xanthobacteraceae bacterium]|nr:ribonuclease J [Xanthobacteraceae bacterium]